MNQQPDLAREIFPVRLIPQGASSVAGRFVRPASAGEMEADPKVAPAPVESRADTAPEEQKEEPPKAPKRSRAKVAPPVETPTSTETSQAEPAPTSESDAIVDSDDLDESMF